MTTDLFRHDHETAVKATNIRNKLLTNSMSIAPFSSERLLPFPFLTPSLLLLELCVDPIPDIVILLRIFEHPPCFSLKLLQCYQVLLGSVRMCEVALSLKRFVQKSSAEQNGPFGAVYKIICLH